MKEKEFISVIKNVLNSKYIGDDCAFLEDLNIVVTQDSLVEDVHFLTEFISPYELGYKSVMVNLSDIAASGGDAKYLTISLSMPSNIEKDFVEEFYKGAKSACGNSVQIVGGDITGGEKIFISVCAIGSTLGRKISSRKNAKIGYKIVMCGVHGSSAIGLDALLNHKKVSQKFIDAHIKPVAQVEFAKQISENIRLDYVMMDTSDGLMDALSTIANQSGVLLEVDFDKIPIESDIKNFLNWQNKVLFGGEDYSIVAVVPQDFECGGVVVGHVKDGSGVDLKMKDKIIHYSKEDVECNIFNHYPYEN